MEGSSQSSPARRQSAEPSFNIGEYKRLNEIGKGSFAMVYKGVHTVNTPFPARLFSCP
jgi:hypothetical protein